MTGEKYNEIEKLAEIQQDFLVPCQEQKLNSDILIKIRNGVIVFSECRNIDLKRIKFGKIHTTFNQRKIAVDKVFEMM